MHFEKGILDESAKGVIGVSPQKINEITIVGVARNCAGILAQPALISPVLKSV